MNDNLPPFPGRDLASWAAQMYQYLAAQSPAKGRADPTPLLLAHKSVGKMERATTPGVILYDPVLETLVFSKGGEFVGVASVTDVAAVEALIAAINAELIVITSALEKLPAIGSPFPVFDHIPGCPVPDNSGTAKFVKLTAGLTGVGQFNEGLLTGESVSGSAPIITATATIIGGPMNAQQVALINTEQTFIRPRTTSGTLQSSQLGAHRHSVRSTNGNTDSTLLNSTGISGWNNGTLGFIEAGIAGNFISDTGGDETRPRNRAATFYMRII